MAQKESIPKIAWIILIISWVIIALANFSNMSTGLLIPTIREQFNIDITTAGYLSTVTFMVQVLLVIPVTLMAGRYNPKYVLGLVYFSTIIAVFIHAFATSTMLLFIGRVFLAIGISGITPCIAGVKDSWIPLKKMTMINGLETFSNTFGQMLGTMGLATLILFFHHWQKLMLFLGIIGAVAVFAWYFFYTDNIENPIKLVSKKESFLKPIKEALGEKSTWLLAVGWPGASFVWIAYTTFWPTYATETLGLGLVDTGIAIGMIPLASTIACLTSPPITNFMGHDKWMICPWGIVLCVAYGASVLTSNFILICITFFIAGFGAFAFVPIGLTVLFKLKTLSPSAIATGTAVILTIANIGSALAGVVIGKLMDSMDLKTALLWCATSPLLWFFTTIFLPELGRKSEEERSIG
jgi:predicted MFS family arabinose efflux permease